MKQRIRLQPKVKTKISPTLMYAGSTVLATGIVAVVAFFYFNMGNSEHASAMSSNLFVSRTDGSWKGGGTWSQPGLPKSGGRVLIASEHTVLLNSEAIFNGVVDVYGTLVFDGGMLKLNSTARINLHEGSKLMVVNDNGQIKISKSKWEGAEINTISTPNVLTAAGALGNIPLPTQMVAFEGNANGEDHVRLSWQTTQERNSHQFEIQRSKDGKHFEILAELEGAGLSNDVLNYQYVDKEPIAGNNYYRIRQVDFEGNYEYGRTIAVGLDEVPFSVVAVDENEKKDALIISFESNLGEVDILLKDRKGNVMQDDVIPSTRGLNYYTLNKENLAHGMYTFSIRQHHEGTDTAFWKHRYLFITN